MLLRNRIARGVAAGALVLSVPALAGCGMNFATDQVYTPAPGANDRAGAVDVLGAAIVSSQDGEGTFIATFSNNRRSHVQEGFPDASDALVSVSGDFQSTLENASDLVIAPSGVLVLSAAENDVPGIHVDGDFNIGDFVEVTLEFKQAETVTLQVPVVCNSNHFAGQDTNPNAGELAEECIAPPAADHSGADH